MTLKYSEYVPVRPQMEEKLKSIGKHPYIIFVEGTDEIYFFEKVLQHLEADEAYVTVLDYSGFGGLVDSIKQLMKQDSVLNRKIRGLLLVVDNDTFDKVRYQLKKELKRNNLELPDAEKFYLASNSLIQKLGFYEIPAFGRNGNLDSLLLDAVIDRGRAADAREYIEKHHRSHTPANDKRVAQAYLAAEGEILRGAGMAFYKKYFKAEHGSIQDVIRYTAEFLSE